MAKNKDESLLELIKNNRFFFISFGLFLVIGAIILMIIEKGDMIFFFNYHRYYYVDLFFRYFTRMGEELAYLLAILVLVFIRYRSALMVPLVGLTVTLTSALAKTFFAYDRPSLYFRNEGLFDLISPVDGVILNGGSNSFPSGHTMSAFAIYTFLALSLPRRSGQGALLFSFAFLVGMSRIYLVQHFFQDVYLGAILGFLIGTIWYHLQFRLLAMPHPWADNSILTRRSTGVAEEEPAPMEEENSS